MSGPVKDHFALKWRAGEITRLHDQLAVEEPLEIRLGGRRFTLTMRTPGHDEELAVGFLFAEGFINSREELGEIRRWRDPQGRPDPNALDVILNVPAAGLRERLHRNFTISSSCGVCGKTSIEALERRIPPLGRSTRISAGALLQMPVLMRPAQAVFTATGGLHAAALFKFVSAAPAASVSSSLRSCPEFELGSDGSFPEGTRDDSERNGRYAQNRGVHLVALREDVGRHNAVDKVIGYGLLHGEIPLQQAAMMVSGRLSFEIVQKAAAAGIEVLCAVSAPSSLAVELAEELAMTLVGFLREPNLNIYTAPERIIC